MPRLTDEHVIPFSFGGHFILPDASCDACMDITGALCGRVCDLMLAPLRWHHGLPSRKTKDKDKKIRVGIEGDHPLASIPIYYEAAPGFISFPVLELPGLLLGKPLAGVNIPVIGMQWADTVPDNLARQLALRAAGVEGAKLINQVPIGDFIRILAQVGHGYHVSQEGYRMGLPLADVVLGKNPNISHFVGGTPPHMNFVSDPRPGHGLHQLVPFAARVNGIGYMAVQIRLFSYLTPPSPVYTVIISQRDIPKGNTYLSFTRNEVTNQMDVKQLVMT